MADYDTFGASQPPSSARTGPPWENPGDFFARYIDTARGVLLDPTTFFSNMRREGGLGPPLTYGMIGMAVGFVIAFAFQMLMPFGGFPGLPPDMRDQLPRAVGLVIGLICVPVLVIVGLFIWSGIVHLLLMLFGGAVQPFETTFRVISYTQGSTGLLNAIPFCGGLIATVWNVIASIIGLARAHETSTGKAAAAVLVPVIACCVVVALSAAALFAFIMAAIGSNR